ncbi:putative glycosyltransferase [Cylindrospermum stagnale PCC 7417]|uniref:Putative glycosyltransferase n=1 Tax=Cylindrospermum stagnale PCC 7417 TaxID=56107 RepID=K9X1F3_9NOST|nr:glycosyltransferase [Cylindrospermum stagnale]AFZ26450.1 putative glycosyltransferase [Cylindrospermum stagnale PCC 7417]
MQVFKPTVSVIIPTYQRGHLVSQAINSVLAQTYKDYEIIVINDGSQDNTPQVLAQFSDHHRITAIHQANQGLSAARNAGIRSAQGKYIAFLDDDDLWEPQKLEKQISVLEANPRIGLIYSDSLFFSDKRGLSLRSYNTAFPTPNLQVLWTLFRYNYIPVLTVVVRRDCLDKVGLFDETLRCCEDYDLWLRLIEKFPIYFLNQPLARYRQSPNNLSQNEEQMFTNHLRVKEKVIERNPEFLKIPVNFLDPYFYNIYLGLANLHIQNHQIEQARRVLHRYREMRGETSKYEYLRLSAHSE